MQNLHDEELTFKPKINKSAKQSTKPIWDRLNDQPERYHDKKVDPSKDEI